MSWQEIRVGDLGEIITGKTPPTSNVDNYGGNIPFITPSDMVGNRSIVSTERYISEKGKNTIKNSILPPHAVCVSCIGSDMGKVVLTTAWSATNQQINSIVCNSHYDYRFVYYLMLTLRETIKSLGKNATAVPILNKTKFSNIQVAVPSLPIQKRIADFLSYYDDLIENNQKQIKLLEEAAQRLYKEWFIDLRFPGYETTPIVDGVPEGWRKGKISDFVPTSSGGTPSRTHSEYYSDGTNLWVKTQELNDGFIFDTEEKITDDAIRNSSAKIIPQGSILMAMYGATIGKIGIAATELTCNQACCVFNLSKIKYATSYLYCWLKDNREFFISQGKGAAQPNLSQAMIKNFDVLIPTADILTTFSQVTDTLLELSAKLHLQNRGLIESRDRLLPKLMSGEIEV